VQLALVIALLAAAPALGAALGSPAQVVLGEVNAERQSVGVSALALDPCLTRLADARAEDMARRAYFGHVTPDGRLPWDLMRAQGCAFRYAAENIAEAENPRQAVTELWNSAEHRRNTLDPRYAKIGIGVASRSDGTEILVEDFTDAR
jgi:uncharacterized protein YkwD